MSVFTWSLYNGGVVTINATVTTWTGSGATTLASTGGSVATTVSLISTSGTSGVVSATPTSTAKSGGWKDRPNARLLLTGSLSIMLAF